MSLTNADMLLVRDVFTASYESTMGRYIDDKRKLAVLELTLRLAYEFKPAHMITPKGLTGIMDLIWTNELHTDFIQSLTFTFIAMWGEAADKYGDLINSLAIACSVDKSNGLNATPAGYAVRLSTESDIVEVLKGNKWLTTILLIMLYIELKEPNDKRKQPPVK